MNYLPTFTDLMLAIGAVESNERSIHQRKIRNINPGEKSAVC
jgi:hypothetical protein